MGGNLLQLHHAAKTDTGPVRQEAQQAVSPIRRREDARGRHLGCKATSIFEEAVICVRVGLLCPCYGFQPNDTFPGMQQQALARMNALESVGELWRDWV